MLKSNDLIPCTLITLIYLVVNLLLIIFPIKIFKNLHSTRILKSKPCKYTKTTTNKDKHKRGKQQINTETNKTIVYGNEIHTRGGSGAIPRDCNVNSQRNDYLEKGFFAERNKSKRKKKRKKGTKI